jgi:hypothetical protein
MNRSFILILLLSILLALQPAFAEGFTKANYEKALTVFSNSLAVHGGEKNIRSLSTIYVDADYSINYQMQGFGYDGNDYISNRPGHLKLFIDHDKTIYWSQSRHIYMKSIYGDTTYYSENKLTKYNDVTFTFGERKGIDFETAIEIETMKNPILILKAGLQNSNSLRFIGTSDYKKRKLNMISVVLGFGKTVTLGIDSENFQLKRAEYLVAGRRHQFSYSDFQTTNGFVLPHFIKRDLPDNAYPAHFLFHVKKYAFSEDSAEVVSLPKTYTLAPPHDTADGKLRVQTLGEGIYWVTQNAANTIFVEFSDHIMAVDAFDRNLSLRIETMRELIPYKPIKYVTTSHHHHDHLAALPFYIRQGATVITAEPFVPLIKRCSENNGLNTLSMDIIKRKKVFKDVSQEVQIFELTNLLHARTMLMIYFPLQKLVYVPDHYEEMYLLENHQAIRVLLTEIERLNLEVEGFIQGHGIYLINTLIKSVDREIVFENLERQPHSSVVLN